MNLDAARNALGVTAQSTAAEVKSAYKRKALETHPDRGGTAAEFQAIAEAYRVAIANVGVAMAADSILAALFAEAVIRAARQGSAEYAANLRAHDELARRARAEAMKAGRHNPFAEYFKRRT